MDQRLSLNLNECDKEQIHLVGAIQPHGYFLAFRLMDKTIYHASQNINALAQLKSPDVIGKSLEDVLGLKNAESLLKLAGAVESSGDQYLRIAIASAKTQVFDVRLFSLEGLIGAELEQISAEGESEIAEAARSVRRGQSFSEDLHASKSLVESAKLACRAIRLMIGYERVMMYRYLPNWDGEVIAEDKTAEAHSFMQHRFPATDIPLPARQLYLRNRSRQIVDSAATAVPIRPTSHYLTHKPLDLSNSKLRAVSPIHLEYLKNMGVASSFSVAVIVDGELWGLVACHGKEPAVLPHDVRLSCEMIASTFAVLANVSETLSSQSAIIQFEGRMKVLFQDLIQTDHVLSTLLKKHSLLEEMFSASGVAFVSADTIEIAGLTPPDSVIKDITEYFRVRFHKESKSVLTVESLEQINPAWEILRELSCGALALHTPVNGDSILIIFRPEMLNTITWGGDPRKNLQKRQYHGVINPRESFESWTETLKGHSAPWKNYEVRGAEYLRDFALNNLLRKETLLRELEGRRS